jgi:hypothetical protein
VVAEEEFSIKSSFSGSFIPYSKIPNFSSRFDPWSAVLCEDYIFRSMIADLGVEEDEQLSLRVTS